MKTSIIILTHNNLDYTKLCIESIRKYTRPGIYELIVVDNYSTDGTVEWLRAQKDIVTIANKENVGFPKGCNQGMEIASGDNILLLNNDTIVTENWLDNLIKALYSSEEIGAVGPVTNHCSYYQAISVTYRTIEEMHEFARVFNQSNESAWEERLKLVGFCLLIKREVVERVGKLDERFSPGNFEDDDFSLRILKAGYKLVLCKDTFIHHFGSVSFRDNVEGFRSLLTRNERKFAEKWGFYPGYSCLIRHDIVDLMDSPEDKEINVLEVGCACGGTLLKVKNTYQNANLFGIELNEHAAAIASKFADVRVDNVEHCSFSYPIDFFDYVIFADVLEHLYDPWSVLRHIKKYLKKDGKLIVSIPNVMHYSVIRGLLNGTWTYTDSGLLDKTHVRFFTLTEIDTMLKEAGYGGMEYRIVTVGKSEEDEKFIDALTQLSSESLRDQYAAYQYLAKAYKSEFIDGRNNELRDLITQLELKTVESDIQETLEQLNQFDSKHIMDTICQESANPVGLLNLIAIKNFERRKYEHVLPYLHRAIDIDSGNTDSLYNLAFVLHFFGENELALRFLNMIQSKDEGVMNLFAQITEPDR